MRLTFNGDERQHVQLDGVPVDCGQDPADVQYSDLYTTATELLDEMDMRARVNAWPACPQCRSAVLESARGEESFWLPALVMA